MLNFSNDIWKYIFDHTSPEDEILAELNRETNLKILYPRMLSGHYQGKFLEIVSKMLQPETILEIGTFTGYSAICLAKGLTKGGKLHTIECNDEITGFALKFIKKSGLEDKIQIHTGDAMQIIPGFNLLFDLVFIDAEKEQYPEYFRLVADKVKSGGIVLADNVLWDGKVAKEPTKPDNETTAIKAFNKMIFDDARFETIILPIRDGIMIARKIHG